VTPASKRVTSRPDPPIREVELAALSADGRRALTVEVGDRRTEIDVDFDLLEATVSPAGDTIALRGMKKSVELRSVADGRLRFVYPAERGRGRLTFSPDGRYLAVADAARVLVYETTDERPRFRLPAPGGAASSAFSADGRILAVVADRITAFQIDSDEPRALWTIDVERPQAAQFLADGRLLLVRDGDARVFRDGRELLRLATPMDDETRWCVRADGRFLSMSTSRGLLRFDLAGGGRPTWTAPIVRPDQLPPDAWRARDEFRAGCALWRTPHGPFVHQSDGPRGWLQPLQLSERGMVVLPTSSGATLVDVDGEAAVVGTVPFAGRLRAGRIAGDTVILLNETGRIFRAPVPTR
jgi:dipeptidyl aminopeptidase/acylaminoacyl peptidase